MRRTPVIRGFVNRKGAIGIGSERGDRQFDRERRVALPGGVDDAVHVVAAQGLGQARDVEQLQDRDYPVARVDGVVAVVHDDALAVGQQLIRR
jgi:hypothetical protein